MPPPQSLKSCLLWSVVLSCSRSQKKGPEILRRIYIRWGRRAGWYSLVFQVFSARVWWSKRPTCRPQLYWMLLIWFYRPIISQCSTSQCPHVSQLIAKSVFCHQDSASFHLSVEPDESQSFLGLVLNLIHIVSLFSESPQALVLLGTNLPLWRNWIIAVFPDSMVFNSCTDWDQQLLQGWNTINF